LQQNPTLSRALRSCRRPGGGSGTRAYDPGRVKTQGATPRVEYSTVIAACDS
jgi:hypothetical protein